jgi:hypothetical protein
MSNSRKSHTIVRKFRDIDDICHIITGKRLSTLVARGISFFGPDLMTKISEDPVDSGDDANPYDILEIRRGASEGIVKAAFRAKAREYHTDTGVHPNAARFQAAQEAYENIMKEKQQKPTD